LRQQFNCPFCTRDKTVYCHMDWDLWSRLARAWCPVGAVVRPSQPASTSSVNRSTSTTTGWTPVRRRTRSKRQQLVSTATTEAAAAPQAAVWLDSIGGRHRKCRSMSAAWTGSVLCTSLAPLTGSQGCAALGWWPSGLLESLSPSSSGAGLDSLHCLLLVRSQKLSWLSLQRMCDANANKPG